MRILHVINTLHTGGAERLVVDIVLHMVASGHEVEIAVLNPDDSVLMQELKQCGVKIHVYSRYKGEYNFLHIFSLRKIMRNYDVVHAHLFPSQYWVAMAARIMTSRPILITTEHNTYNSRVKYRLTSWLDRIIYRNYQGIFCISTATVDFMKTRVEDSSVLFQITNGINVERFRSVRSVRKTLLPSLPENAKVLMQVARFREQKNQACAIRAMKLLPECYFLVLVGAGETLNSCKKLAQECGVDDRVLFLGDRADIPQLLSVADMVIMSSHWEGFGLSAAEAMAAGKIVLASDLPGLSQVVSDCELRFKPDDEEELKKLILKYSDPALRYSKEQWCRQNSAKFDISHTVSEYLNIYQLLLNRKYEEEKNYFQR